MTPFSFVHREKKKNHQRGNPVLGDPRPETFWLSKRRKGNDKMQTANTGEAKGGVSE